MTLAAALKGMQSAFPDFTPSPELDADVSRFVRLEQALDRAFDALIARDTPAFHVAMADFNNHHAAMNRAEISRNDGLRQTLLERDGDDCWLCGDPLGDDITFEHLIPRSVRGSSHSVNLALAHEACNVLLGNKPLAEKIAMREAARREVVA